MASTEMIDAFLAEPRNVMVAGIRRDGTPQLSPNWFYWDGERFYVSTTRNRAQYAIFRRAPGPAGHRRRDRLPHRAGPRHRGDPRGPRGRAGPLSRHPQQARPPVP